MENEQNSKEPTIPNFGKNGNNDDFEELVNNILNGSVKNKHDSFSEVEYCPEKEVVSSEIIRNNLRKIYFFVKDNLKSIIILAAGSGIIASAAIGASVPPTINELTGDTATRNSISAIMISHKEGRVSNPGTADDVENKFSYDYDKLVDGIIEKGHYKDSDVLYLQLAKIYNGLLNENNHEDQIKISKLYTKLRDKVLEKDKKEIGPESIEDWLILIGKHDSQANYLDEMLQDYLAWFESTREEVVEDKGNVEIVIGDKIFVINEDNEVEKVYKESDFGVKL